MYLSSQRETIRRELKEKKRKLKKGWTGTELFEQKRRDKHFIINDSSPFESF